MKKNLLLLALSIFALALASCGGEGEKNAYRLDVDAKSLAFIHEGATSQTVNVTAENVEWDAVLNDAATTWLHIAKTEGAVTVTVDDNSAATARTAKFTIKSTNLDDVISREVTVTQIGVDTPSISIGVTVSFDMLFTSEGGSQFVTVTANDIAWDAALTQASDWVSVEKNATGILVTATPNTSEEPREAQLAVTADGIEDIIVTIKQEGVLVIEAEFTTAYAEYYGDAYGVGLDNFTVYLMADETTQNGVPSDIYPDFALDFLTDASDILNPEMAVGTYEFSYSEENFTVLLGNYTNLFLVEEEVPLRVIVKSGVMTIARDGDDYAIGVEIITNRDVIIRGSYTGPIDIENYAIESTLTGDVDFGTISGDGDLILYGDYYGNGTYNWVVQAWDDGVYVDEDGYLQGTGAIVSTDLTAEQTDEEGIPAGTYTVSDSFEAGNAAKGSYNIFFGPGGTVYVFLEDGYIVEAGPLKTGELRITRDGSNYRIEYDGADELANSITGAYDGELTFVSMAGAPMQKTAQMQFVKGSKTTKTPVIGARVKVRR